MCNEKDHNYIPLTTAETTTGSPVKREMVGFCDRCGAVITISKIADATAATV